MLRTKPLETRSSMACQVVSKDMVVSMSNIPSSANSLLVLPTPSNKRIKKKGQWEFVDAQPWEKGDIYRWQSMNRTCMLYGNWEVHQI